MKIRRYDLEAPVIKRKGVLRKIKSEEDRKLIDAGLMSDQKPKFDADIPANSSTIMHCPTDKLPKLLNDILSGRRDLVR